jgi:hypothetical protein
MKRPVIETFLSRLDNSLRWTGFPARVADAMSGASVDRKHRPLRWFPIWPIAFSCALFIFSLTWPSVLNRFSLGGVIAALVRSPGAVIAIIVGFMSSIMGMLPGVHMQGPLGKPSREDDEREAALRKDSFLFCFGLLFGLNCLGQPILMILAVLQHWQVEHSASVAMSAFMLNATLFGCLPTLYASWKLRQLPKE